MELPSQSRMRQACQQPSPTGDPQAALVHVSEWRCGTDKQHGPGTTQANRPVELACLASGQRERLGPQHPLLSLYPWMFCYFAEQRSLGFLPFPQPPGYFLGMVPVDFPFGELVIYASGIWVSFPLVAHTIFSRQKTVHLTVSSPSTNH